MPVTKDNFKVIHLCPAGDFAWRFLRGFLLALVDQGIETGLITAPGAYTDRLESLGRFPVYRVNFSRAVNPAGDLSALLSLYQVLKAASPDILHAHTPKGGIVGLCASALFSKASRVFTLHGLPFLGARGFSRFALKGVDRMSLGLAHKVLAVSPDMKEIAVTELGCDPAKIVIPCAGSVDGVDTGHLFNPDLIEVPARELKAQLGIEPDELVVGFFGRLMKEKGLSELAEAWNILRNQNPNLHLLAAGPLDDRNPPDQKQFEKLKADPRVHIHPEWIDHEEMPRWYAVADIVVVPSRREGLGMAILEAGAMSRPVVASNVPGCRCAVRDGETGTLVCPADVVSLAAALQRYISDAGLRAVHGRAGRKFVAEFFKSGPIREAVISTYRGVLNQKAGKLLPRSTRITKN